MINKTKIKYFEKRLDLTWTKKSQVDEEEGLSNIFGGCPQADVWP